MEAHKSNKPNKILTITYGMILKWRIHYLIQIWVCQDNFAQTAKRQLEHFLADETQHARIAASKIHAVSRDL